MTSSNSGSLEDMRNVDPDDGSTFLLNDYNMKFTYNEKEELWISDFNSLYISIGYPLSASITIPQILDIENNVAYEYDTSSNQWVADTTYGEYYIQNTLQTINSCSNSLGYVPINGGTIVTPLSGNSTYTSSSSTMTTGYMSSWNWVSNLMDSKFDIYHAEDNVFLIQNLSHEERDLYKWILSTDYEYTMEDIEQESYKLSFKLTFLDSEGAVEFKLTWMDNS